MGGRENQDFGCWFLGFGKMKILRKFSISHLSFLFEFKLPYSKATVQFLSLSVIRLCDPACFGEERRECSCHHSESSEDTAATTKYYEQHRFRRLFTMRIMNSILFAVVSLSTTASALTLTMGTGNSFGRVFRISTWGESHGGGVGVVLDGCPPRLPITREEVQEDLDRRRPGQSRITTPRNEADAVEIMSGLTPDGLTLGTPIAMLVRNKDQRSQDYLENDMSVAYRPSHADATYDAKYGVRAIAGGGRSSARETIGRVAAGAIARKILQKFNGIEVLAYVSKVQDIEAENVNDDTFTMEDVDANMVRCPDAASADKMLARIDEIRKSGNSIGGVVTCVARNVPAGWGAPVFDKLEADLAKACMSIPAAKGFESGDGFAGTLLTGKDHNDEFYIDPVTGVTRTKTNRSGGIQGGISNGENIVVHVAFKPTSTIGQLQVRY